MGVGVSIWVSFSFLGLSSLHLYSLLVPLRTHALLPHLPLAVCCGACCPFARGVLLAPRLPLATAFALAIPASPTSVTVSRLWPVSVSCVGRRSHVPFPRETTEHVASQRIAAAVSGKKPTCLKKGERREEDGRRRPTCAGEPGSRCAPRARETTLDGWSFPTRGPIADASGCGAGPVLTTSTGPLDRGQKQKILEAEDEEVKNVHMKDHAYSRMQEKNLSAQANVHPRATKEFHSKMVNREKF